MKRTIIIVLLFVAGFFQMSAQTYRYRASEFAFGERTYSGKIAWGEWERCNMLITINFDEDYIKVYSEVNQDYVIVSTSDSYRDSDGADNIQFMAIDEEGIECTLRLRIQRNGVTQLYSIYDDIAWVYSGLRRL